MNQQKKRMKLLQHKREADRLWEEKRNLRRAEFEKELAQERAIKQREAEEQARIEETKKKLIEENMPYIVKFCSVKLKKYVN